MRRASRDRAAAVACVYGAVSVIGVYSVSRAATCPHALRDKLALVFQLCFMNGHI